MDKRILEGYSPWGHKELDTTEATEHRSQVYHLITIHHMTKMNLLAILQSSFSHFLLSLLLLNTVNSKDHVLKLPPGWLKTSHIEYWTRFCFLSIIYLSDCAGS